MWFDERAGDSDWSAGLRHLRHVDPALGRVIQTVGPCTLKPRRDYFVVLCQSIFSQQISTAVATVLFTRFRKHFPQMRPTPARVVAFLTGTDPQVIRGCGISRQKESYLLDLATHFVDGRVPTARFTNMSDDEIVDALDGVRGIGRWTAEMFLIFVLNRPDVFPVDDLGLQKGVQRLQGLPTLPKPRELLPLGEAWRPYRSLATWYLWRWPAPVKPGEA